MKRSPLKRKTPLASKSLLKRTRLAQRRAKQRKTKTLVRCRAHLAFVRTLPCIACGEHRGIYAHHHRAMGGGGTGIKPSDTTCVPLCPLCHIEVHRSARVGLLDERETDAYLRHMANEIAKASRAAGVLPEAA